jgi:chromosome partitioning protein
LNIIAIVNQKGGVAKTTTTSNLGACIAAKGQKVLLIDLDPQANLTLGMRCDWSGLPYGLSDVLLNPEQCHLTKIVRQIGDTPLYLAPGLIDLARCEMLLMPFVDSAFRLRQALREFAQSGTYDWVLIDCPPSLGRLTQNALVACTHLLVPTEAKFYSFAGIDTLNKLVAGMRKDLQIRAQLLGVLITMFERGTRMHRTIAEEIRGRFGGMVLDTVIHKNVKLAEAEIEGVPIIEFDKNSRGSKDYSAFTDELLTRINSK